MSGGWRGLGQPQTSRGGLLDADPETSRRARRVQGPIRRDNAGKTRPCAAPHAGRQPARSDEPIQSIQHIDVRGAAARPASRAENGAEVTKNNRCPCRRRRARRRGASAARTRAARARPRPEDHQEAAAARRRRTARGARGPARRRPDARQGAAGGRRRGPHPPQPRSRRSRRRRTSSGRRGGTPGKVDCAPTRLKFLDCASSGAPRAGGSGGGSRTRAGGRRRRS